MTHSILTSQVVPAYSGNFTNRGGRQITRITPHHMAGVLSGERCAKLFQQPGRYASANYCIGPDGDIVCNVEEEYCAYTSSSYDNDSQAITFELSNDGGDNWHVSDATVDAFVKVAAEACKHYGIPSLIVGENLTWHSMFASTACVPIWTELLTKDGWKQLKDIEVGEEVAAAHMDDLSIKFSPVQAKVPEKEQSTWVVRGIEATADHRMIFKWQNSDKLRVREFQEIWGSDCVPYIPNAGFYKEAKGLPLSNAELDMLAAIQADGHYCNGEKDGKDSISFHLKLRRKIERLIDLADTLGFSYKHYNMADGSVKINFDKKLKAFAEKYLEDKKFSYKLLDLTYDQAVFFLDILQDWDGCRAGNDYSSNVRQNIDVVTAIAALNGIGVTRNSENRIGFGNQFRTFPPQTERRRKQNQKVSCVTVESGFILVRQGNITTIVGNCPGPYLKDKLPELAARINKLIANVPEDKPTNNDNVSYQAHVQGIGDTAQVRDGQAAGTTGQSKRLEAIRIDTSKLNVQGILRLGCQLHIATKGWIDFGECKGQWMGTKGESHAIEAIMLYVIENTTGLTPTLQAHQSGYGWTGAMDVTNRGATTGSTGQSRQLEAFRLWLK